MKRGERNLGYLKFPKEFPKLKVPCFTAFETSKSVELSLNRVVFLFIQREFTSSRFADLKLSGKTESRSLVCF